MKHKLCSLALVFAMLAAVLPFSAVTAAGEIIVSETFEEMADIPANESGTFGNSATATSLRAITMTTATGTDGTNKSMKMPEKAVKITLSNAMAESYFIEFDMYIETELTSSSTNNFLMKLEGYAKRPFGINMTNKKFQTNASDLSLAYETGHWYHTKITVVMDESTNKEKSYQTTITDLATGASASSKTIAAANTTASAVKQITLGESGYTTGSYYIDNFEVYTGTAGGNLSRAAMIPNATAYKVSGASSDENGGTVSVTGGANKEENYLKTGGTATATAEAKEGYAFTGWTAEGITLSAEQQKANPLEITVESADVTLTAAFEQQAAAPKYALSATAGTGGKVSVSPTGAEFEENTEVTVTATPDSGYKFTGWTATGVTLTDTAANPATFNMPAGAVTMEAAFTAKTNASITPATAAYDANDASRSALEVTLTPGDYTFTALKNGSATLTAGTDYTVAGNKYTIATSYLDTLPAGANTLTFDMDGGTDPTVTVTVSDNTPTFTLNATAGEGGKVTVSPEGTAVKQGAEVTVTATPNSGYGFVNWTANGVTLADATAKVITFTMPAGDVTLTANFKALRTASLDRTTANYDQSAPDRKDIEVTLDTGDYTFVQIKKTSAEVLVEGTDYTVDGNKYTIKTSYLDTKDAGKTTTLAFIVAYDGKNDSKSARLAININKTIEQNTFETWADKTGTPPTEFVFGSANGAYSYSSYSALQMDKADNGTVQNTSFLLQSGGQPLYIGMTPKGVSGAWTLAYDFYGTFEVSDFASITRLQLIFLANTRAFTVETSGNFAFNGIAVKDESGATMTYTPNHWYHVELYVPASGNAIGILTDTTTGQTGTVDYGPNADARKCGYFQIQTCKNIALYLDNIDLYLGAPDRTRLETPTIAPGTTPPPAGSHTVTAASANNAQGTAAVTTEGTAFETGASVTVEATPKAGYKFAGWTAEGITLSAEQQTQNPLTITMPDADVKLTAAFAAKTNASVTPTAANYDKYTSHADHKAITVTLTAGDYTFSALKNGTAALTKDTDYTVSGNTYTIAASYLNTLPIGPHTLTFEMDGGTNPAVTVTVANSTPGLQTYTVTAASADSAQGTAAVKTAGAAFEEGTEVTVEATANKGYKFAGWTAAGITLSTEQQTQNPLTITMPAGDVTLTAAFGVDELAGTVEQNTFETWELPASGKKQDFVFSENGNYNWTATLTKDYAYRGAKENNSLKMENGALNINLTEALSRETGYTVAFDFIGTKEDYAVGDYMVLIQYPTVGRRPFEIGKDGIFEANAVDMKLRYVPNQWFHVDMHIAPTTGAIASTTLTVTNTATGETATTTFNLNGDPYTEKQLRINALQAFGPLYIDNLDIYEGKPDSKRLTTTTVIPGTQTGLRPDSDYFIDLENEAEGVTIKKNLDSADDNALVMSALYDNSTGKPSLMAAKTKNVTLKTGETVSLSAEEIVHKPEGNNYSVRYFIWRLGENGETLDVLAAIDGE